jgi:hypothetical protein
MMLMVHGMDREHGEPEVLPRMLNHATVTSDASTVRR